MNKKPQWLLALGLATVIAGSGIVMAATNNDTQSPDKKGDGFGRKPMHHFMQDGKGPMGQKMANSALLELLKIDAATLKTELRSGKSLAAIAAERGVSEEKVVDVVKKQMEQRVEEAAKAGRITPEQAKQKKERIGQHAADFVKGEHAKRMQHKKQELLALLKMDKKSFAEERQSGKKLVDIAAEHGVDKQQLKDFFQAQMTQHMDQAIKEGRITPEQAQKMKERMADRAEAFANGEHPKHMKMDNNALLALLKIDEQTLREEMKSGKTLLAIGEERGVTKQQLVDVRVKQMTERLEKAVKEGRITEEKAAQMKLKMADRAEKFVSQPMNHGQHKAK
jgi:hypothetical protein